jgi:hypothetical protein
MCALQYRDNLCDKNLVPAMVLQCNKWETCMNRNPAVVGRAKVGAKLIAEVLNGFVEPISWKTLVRDSIVVSGGGLLSIISRSSFLPF